MTAQPAPQPPPTQWHSAHIYYYEPDKTDLLLDGIRPLLNRLHPLVTGAHVLRHWRQGPHLRLNIRTDAHTWVRTVQPAIDESIGAYLAARPSTARLDQRSLLAQHRFLAERENEHGPLIPFHPDNSIQYAPFDDRLHVLTDPEAVDLINAFYTDSTPLLFQMLEHARAGHDRLELIALGLMLANSVTLVPPITDSFVSYRSHSEGFIAQCADPEATRARFDAHYDAHRDRFTARVRAIMGTLDGRAAQPVPFVREWAGLMAAYRDRATPLIAQGKLIRPLVYNENEAARNPAEIHRLMFGNRAFHRSVFEPPRFSCYRLLINYTYLQITRLGLTPPERMRLCHLAANAIEEVYNVNALDAIRHTVAAHPNP
ncbi:thiopeptide maturation pyridine synthase [Nonomuraea sp. NPDC001699]